MTSLPQSRCPSNDVVQLFNSSLIKEGAERRKARLGSAAMATMFLKHRTHRVTPFDAPLRLFCPRCRSSGRRIRKAFDFAFIGADFAARHLRRVQPPKAGSHNGAGRRTRASRVRRSASLLTRAGAASRPAPSSVPDNAPQVGRDDAKLDYWEENIKDYIPIVAFSHFIFSLVPSEWSRRHDPQQRLANVK